MMAAAKTAPPELILTKFDFENLVGVLGKLDNSGAEVFGSIFASDLRLQVRYNENECLHEIVSVEPIE